MNAELCNFGHTVGSCFIAHAVAFEFLILRRISVRRIVSIYPIAVLNFLCACMSVIQKFVLVRE